MDPVKSTPLIEVRNLYKRFRRFRKPPVEAVRGLSFTLRRGEVLALLGPNGSGKTTTFRIVATLLQPDRGEIRWQGVPVHTRARAYRQALGYLPPEPGLYRNLTVREHLWIWGRIQGLSGAALRTAIESVVERFELQDVLHERAGRLSTGYRQRAALARTFLHDPDILVLDEPTRGVDVPTSVLVEEAVRDARRRGKGVLFSTHLMEEAEHLADRIVVIYQGRPVAEGTMEALQRRTGKTRLREIFLALIYGET